MPANLLEHVAGPPLIAGGAAATATKFGLFKFLAKAWKVVLIAVFGFLAVLKNKIMSLFSRKESVDISDQMDNQPPAANYTEGANQEDNFPNAQ